jgi:hypothetical protein
LKILMILKTTCQEDWKARQDKAIFRHMADQVLIRYLGL